MKQENDDELTAVSQEVVEPAYGEEIVNDAEPATSVSEPPTENETGASGVPQEEVDRLVAEAEARGYARGRNEVLAAGMHTSQLWENSCRTAMEEAQKPDPAMNFLSKIRPSIWD
jgi:hypothetical protein